MLLFCMFKYNIHKDINYVHKWWGMSGNYGQFVYYGYTGRTFLYNVVVSTKSSSFFFHNHHLENHVWRYWTILAHCVKTNLKPYLLVVVFLRYCKQCKSASFDYKCVYRQVYQLCKTFFFCIRTGYFLHHKYSFILFG